MMKKLKSINNIYLYIVCVFMIALFMGLNRIYISDFNPINGDFQSYNAFRRILDGQIPYKDFANYLGMGIIFINVPFLFFFNSFTASLFITNFSVCVMFCVAVTMTVYFATSKRNLAYILGVVAPTVVLFEKLWERLPFVTLSVPGNSMRMARGFLPFLLIIILYIFMKITKKNFFEMFESKIAIPVMGFVIGAFFVWSNDFGIVSILSSSMIMFVMGRYIYGKFNRKFFSAAIKFASFLILGALISLTIVSGFNPRIFVDFTRGVASYQYWYYGLAFVNKKLTIGAVLGNISFTIFLGLYLILLAVYIVKIKMKTITQYDIFSLFINTTACLTALMYTYSSGSYAYEIFSLSIFFTFLGFAIKKIMKLFNKRGSTNRGWMKLAPTMFLILVLLFAFGSSIGALKKNTTDRDVPYVEELKGYTKYAKSVEDAEEFLDGEKVFSTYASVLETVRDEFQPTGTDYIIHALGDKQREDYLNNFLSNDYKYALTMRYDSTPYEGWSIHANWFWYRELFKNYKPVFSNDYSVIWEKASKPQKIDAKIKIKEKKIDDSTYTITLKSENKESMIADISLAYSSEYVTNLYRMQTLNKIVSVKIKENYDFFEVFYIPEESEGYSVPVVMKDGVGRIKISTLPNECTKLDVKEVTLNQVLPNPKY